MTWLKSVSISKWKEDDHKDVTYASESKKPFLSHKLRGNPNDLKDYPCFTTEQIEVFWKEGKCFRCGSRDGHKVVECLEKLLGLKKQKKT